VKRRQQSQIFREKISQLLIQEQLSQHLDAGMPICCLVKKAQELVQSNLLPMNLRENRRVDKSSKSSSVSQEKTSESITPWSVGKISQKSSIKMAPSFQTSPGMSHKKLRIITPEVTPCQSLSFCQPCGELNKVSETSCLSLNSTPSIPQNIGLDTIQKRSQNLSEAVSCKSLNECGECRKLREQLRSEPYDSKNISISNAKLSSKVRIQTKVC
jgi:hypothetical protein